MKVDRETNDLIVLISFWILGIHKFSKSYVIRQHAPKTSFSRNFQRGKEMCGWEAKKYKVMKK